MTLGALSWTPVEPLGDKSPQQRSPIRSIAAWSARRSAAATYVSYRSRVAGVRTDRPSLEHELPLHDAQHAAGLVGVVGLPQPREAGLLEHAPALRTLERRVGDDAPDF